MVPVNVQEEFRYYVELVTLVLLAAVWCLAQWWTSRGPLAHLKYSCRSSLIPFLLYMQQIPKCYVFYR